MFTCVFPVFSSATETVNGGYIVLADKNDARLTAAGETLAKYVILYSHIFQRRKSAFVVYVPDYVCVRSGARLQRDAKHGIRTV